MPAGARRVLDLGAGTGKLTAGLAARGLEVTAVEPSDEMRGALREALVPRDRVRVLAGAAEAIPLRDATVDAVLVAQAWHWVDPARAVPEVARALRPGGRLGLVWNTRDDRVPWVARLSALLDGSPEHLDADHTSIRPPFGPVERFDTTWTQELAPADLIELVASRSYVITLDEADRVALLARVRALIDEHPAFAGRERIELPYVTRCARADLG